MKLYMNTTSTNTNTNIQLQYFPKENSLYFPKLKFDDGVIL